MPHPTSSANEVEIDVPEKHLERDRRQTYEAIPKALLHSVPVRFTCILLRQQSIPGPVGGLGISNPCNQSTDSTSSSMRVTAPLVALILQQSHDYSAEAKAEQLRERRKAVTLRR